MRRKSADVPVDTFYCTVESWTRAFTFQVNRMPPMDGLPPREHGFLEHDVIKIIGTIRYHSTNRKTRNRTGQRLTYEAWPIHVDRSNWRMDPEAVGGVDTDADGVAAHGFLPADVFFSLPPALAAGVFNEMSVTVRNLRYRHGNLDGVSFDPELTPMEDFER